MESVLRDRHHAVPEHARGGRAAARAAPARAGRRPRGAGLAIGSAGTHPFAMWEDQRIVARPRYRDLIAGLQFVARQELIFGVHVHVGVDDPDKAIHVANGMRVHVPLLLALSANSPFWRADATGLLSTRTPIFRAFPRVGIPPRYDDWDDYQRRIDFMVESQRDRGLHLPLVRRPAAPELRHGRDPRDGRQTRVEHTLGLAALVQAMVKELCEHFEPATSSPATRTRCSTRTSCSPPGTGSRASSWTCPTRRACRPPSWRAGCWTACAARPGAGLRRRARLHRRPARAGATAPRASWSSTRRTTISARSWARSSRRPSQPRTEPPGSLAGVRILGRGEPSPTSSSSARTAASEVSPYVTECPYCGQRVRKRAPKIERDGAPQAEPPAAPGARAAAAARRRDPGHRARDARPGPRALLIVPVARGHGRDRGDEVDLLDLGAPARPDRRRLWRFVATPFVHDNLGYAFVALTAVGIFGTLLERRFGRVVPVAVSSLRRGAARRPCGRAPPLDVLPRGGRERRGARPAVRLVRGRPPGRAARATTARTTCSASTCSPALLFAALARHRGGQHRRRPWAAPRSARCSGSCCRCSRAERD